MGPDGECCPDGSPVLFKTLRKFLGLLLNGPHLTWGCHIQNLVTSCHNRPNLMKLSSGAQTGQAEFELRIKRVRERVWGRIWMTQSRSPKFLEVSLKLALKISSLYYWRGPLLPAHSLAWPAETPAACCEGVCKSGASVKGIGDNTL